MSRGAVGCGVLAVIGFVIILTTAMSHRRLVERDEQVLEAWRDLNASYEARSGTIDELAAKLDGAIDEGTVRALVMANDHARRQHTETAPGSDQLKEFELVQRQLSEALAGVESEVPSGDAATARTLGRLRANQIAIEQARKQYDAATLDYNRLRRRFPTVFLATLRGLGDRPYLEPATGAAQ